MPPRCLVINQTVDEGREVFLYLIKMLTLFVFNLHRV